MKLELTLSERPETLPTGSVVDIGGDLVMVACLSSQDYRLITLGTGNRWLDTSFTSPPTLDTIRRKASFSVKYVGRVADIKAKD